MKQEIEKFIRSNCGKVQQAFFDYEIYGEDLENHATIPPSPNDDEVDDDEEFQLPEGWTFKCVEDVGGEDQGSTYFKVFKFSKDGQDFFYKFYGWYASYEGSEYEDFVQVTPKQKTITVYE